MGHSHATCLTSSPNSPRTQAASQKEEIIFWSDFSPLSQICGHLRGYSPRSNSHRSIETMFSTFFSEGVENLFGWHQFLL
jgi:hypothetical protein